MPNSIPKTSQAPLPTKPNYDPFSSLTTSHPTSRSATPSVPSFPQSQSNPVSSPQSPSDPFASLSTPAPRQPSPFPSTIQQQPPTPSPSASLFNFTAPNVSQSQVQIGPAKSQPTNGALAPADDDWNFASALPEDNSTLPSANAIIVSNTTVKITFQASRPDSSSSVVSIQALFSNNTPNAITEYTFQVAVTKVSTSNSYPLLLAYHLILGIHIKTYTSIWEDIGVLPTKCDQSADSNSWCLQRTG